jgi:hypothetical protein
MRILFYYQTPVDISFILKYAYLIYGLYVSSVHFGTDNNNIPRMYLNNLDLSDNSYTTMWDQLREAKVHGVKLYLMVGGAGLAYEELFKNFTVYYRLLYENIKKYHIEGVDLDIEEMVNISDVKMLIKRLRTDFGKDFVITMAPIAQDLQYNTTGSGGFSYKELFTSKEGKEINWFNVQAYWSYNIKDYKMIIDNGYPSEKIIFGMESEQCYNFYPIMDTIKKLKTSYNFLGVFNWEYSSTKPSQSEWLINITNMN